MTRPNEMANGMTLAFSVLALTLSVATTQMPVEEYIIDTRFVTVGMLTQDTSATPLPDIIRVATIAE